MSTPDRATLLQGPAYATHNSASLHFGDDLTVEFVEEKIPKQSSSFGIVGRSWQNRYVDISGTPIMWNNLAVMFPYATKNVGDTLFGATDLPMVITPRNGRPLTIVNVMPLPDFGLSCHAGKDLVRPMKWRGLVANAADPSLEASYFTRGAIGTDVAQTGLDLTKLPRSLYTAVMNAVTYRAKDGFELDVTGATAPDDENGLHLNYRFTEAPQATVKFTPISLLEADYATLMGWDGIKQGGERAAYNFVLTGGSSGMPIITLSKMQPAAARTIFGKAPRTGEITLESIRQISAGNLAALWAFSAVA